MRQNTASKCFHKQTLATRSLNLRSKDGKKKPTKKGMMPLSSAPTEMLLNSVITESNQFAIIADLGPSNCTAYAESTPLPPFPLSLPLPTHSLLWLGYTPSKTRDVRTIVQTSRRPKPGKKKQESKQRSLIMQESPNSSLHPTVSRSVRLHIDRAPDRC